MHKHYSKHKRGIFTKGNLTGLLILFITTFFLYSCTNKQVISPETALQSYLQNNDKSFKWEVKESYNSGDLKIYNLLVTSQKWREHTWTHQLTILVPRENNYDGALLFINGGSNKDEKPNWKKKDDGTIKMMGMIASKNKAIVAVLSQVPNQPFYDGLTEDALISYTLHNYKKDKDFNWPLLFPMVKSAVRSMDAIQAFSTEVLEHEISRFVVSGASKRGWTTWIAGASDPRVSAIAPMVIDMLNMPVNIDYHLKAWGDYSIQIEDYVKLGIAQDVGTPDGKGITTMVDPFSYREKLTMPKLIIIGTNDEYWPVDAIKHYYKGLPGENYIHYVPNAGHGLGDKKQAIQALSAFFGTTMMNKKNPVCSWDVSDDGGKISLNVKASQNELIGAVLWTVDSEDRDFRDNTFVSNKIEPEGNAELQVMIDYPDSGFRAFYLDLLYPDPNGGVYSKSTRMFVTNENEIFID